ncbi:MAG TPA: substrate-binding domain-containing protein [Vicinamibacterales bacterium]|nr:substrate-binding domain-containing protein [Vicinamibacterales bacterium]
MRGILLAYAAILAFLAAACGGSSPQPGRGSAAANVRLQGAGSTFDAPLFSKVFDAFDKQSGIQVNYQSIGSGGGVQQVTNGVVDFGATDYPLNDEQTKAAEAAGGPIVHVPVTMGAVSVGYNLSIDGLKLDGDTLSGIYLGTITKWNDADRGRASLRGQRDDLHLHAYLAAVNSDCTESVTRLHTGSRISSVGSIPRASSGSVEGRWRMSTSSPRSARCREVRTSPSRATVKNCRSADSNPACSESAS